MAPRYRSVTGLSITEPASQPPQRRNLAALSGLNSPEYNPNPRANACAPSAAPPARMGPRRAPPYGAFFSPFPKSTVGTSRAAADVTSKYGRSFAPVTFAVSTCGKVRMYVLYVRTAPL